MNWPPKIQQWLRKESNHWAERLSREVDHELRRCFGSSMERIGEKGPTRLSAGSLLLSCVTSQRASIGT